MKKQDELVIITKTYDLILWSCNHTGRQLGLTVPIASEAKIGANWSETH